MSPEEVRRIVARTILDDALLTAFLDDPWRTLAGHELTGDELAALTSGDQDRMRATGLTPLAGVHAGTRESRPRCAQATSRS